MIRFFSRYHPRFVRSLAYMLQASEYRIREYFAWYRRVRDFRSVERRKRLVATPKSIAVYAALALFLLTEYAAALVALFWWKSAWAVALSAALLCFAPIIAAYAIVAFLAIARIVVQKPVEYVILRRAKAILARHPGVKIGIAGSFGKTSMREIVRTVLGAGKSVAAPPHSYNTPLAIGRFARTLNRSEEVLIFELGEYRRGDVTALCRIVQPTIGIITGANEAHLTTMGSVQNAVRTVYELAEWIGDGTVYVNGENAAVAESAAAHHLRYTRSGVGNVAIQNAETGIDGTKATMALDGRAIDAHSGLLGLHQLGPLAVAADLGLRLGLAPGEIQRGIAATTPFAHRLQPKQDPSGVITLDDSYNGNPDGVHAITEFLRTLKGHRRFYVTPGLVEMGERAEAVHARIGEELAEAGIEKVVLIRNSVTPFIKKGLDDAGYAGEVIWFDDAVAAYTALPQMTVRGDVVVLQNDWPDQYA